MNSSSPKIFKTFFVGFACPFILAIMGQNVFAQPASGREPNETNKNREISVQDTFSPSFQIEPLSHRVSGKAGDAIPFHFEVNSEFDGDVEVLPMGLRQELNGQILHDLDAKSADTITLLSPSRMRTAANRSSKIEGVVRVPRSDAKHHSVGILVRDLGRDNGITTKRRPDGTIATQAAVKFMTQYVLRLDISVENARGEEGRGLKMEAVKIVAQDGRPKFQLTLSNPTDSTFEFEARARIRSSPSDRSNKPLRLALPVRADIEDDSRYTSRILPKAKVRLEEFLPEAIASGEYEVDMDLLIGERSILKDVFKLYVDAKDFPAQEVLIAQVGEGVQVSPAQIELSQIRGGNRRVTVLLKNTSQSSKTIKLTALSETGLEMGEISTQPGEVHLAPNSSRKISLTLKGQPQSEESVRFGSLLVEATTGKSSEVTSKKLPLAMILKKTTTSELLISTLAWDGTGDQVGFRTKITNSNTTHMPVDARLTIYSESGQKWVALGGYGKWVMPNSSFPIFFRLEKPLSPGEYLLRCEVKSNDGKPIAHDQRITVTDLDAARRAD